MNNQNELRISYMIDGRSQYTGVFYDKVRALKALSGYKAWTKAWLQAKQLDGSWRTIE